jgi:malonyl CoA-acyl carrier protein transacylase/aryl carrier-like protein
MLVLQRLDDAVRERRTIHGVIRGTAINHDGRSTSLTAPNRRAQEEVGRAALADAQARPDDVVYLETHGTGTVLGDPIEIEAAMSVYAEKSEPLVVGALKANIGHLEAAAGAAGVVKAALVLTNEVVPPQLHLRDLNPMLLPHASRIVIPRSESRLPRGPTQKPMASVMAMGMTGTNAYAVLEAPPPTASPREGSHAPSVLCLSARSARALDELSRAYAKHLHTLPEDRLEDVAFTACVGRTHFAHRLAVSSTSLGTLASELERHAEGKPSSVRRGRSEGPKRPLAFLFTGQGSQYVGMGADLYAAEPVFRAEIDRCSDALAPVLRRSVRDALFEATAEGQPGLDDTAMTQPALFAFEWAMTRLWAARGVVPDIVLGHSFGELVAMCVAGMLELEDALRLVAVRGALMSALPQGGAMYALATSAERAERAIVDLGADAEIAALNGPLSTVIAGSELGVSHVAQVLLAEGVQVKRLVVSAAFHSRQMDPMLADFVSLAGKLTVSEPRRAVVSAVLGRRLAAADVDLAYWRQSIRSPVRFRAGVAAVVAEGARTFVEVGPHPALLGMARECVEDADANTWIASARRKRPAREQLAEACADLYVCGVEPRWETLFEGIPARFTPLPTYQFQHRAYWVGDPTSPRRDETEDGVERSPSGVVLAMDREARRAHIATFLRETVALLISSGDDTVAIDVNLIDAGLDSLRATQLLSRIRTGLGVVVTPGDVAAAATISGLCSRVDGLLDVKGAASGSTAASPLVTIRAEGVKTPIFCMHPAGGQVSPYLRLRTLLDGVPIYAFQSRAVASALPEHATLAAMAEEYARAVADSRPTGPVRLLGWSMGGVVAHAVASVLESRGRVVELVAMIDSPPAGGHAALLDETRLCLSGVVFDATPEPPTREALQKAFESLPNETERWRAHLEASGVLRVGAHTHATFDAALRLYRTHLELVREHEPSVIAAPLLVWWADSPLRTAGRVWGERTRGGYRESTVGGDHFSVVKSPLIERIIREMESWSTP